MPAVVRDADDRDTLLLGLVENVAREDLTPVEEARAYAVLLDEFGLSLGEIAERVGRSKPSVSNRLRLLELPDDVLEHARAPAADRGSCTRGARRARTTTAARRLARRDRPEGHVGARRRARRALGRRAHEGARRTRPGRPGPRGARDGRGDEAYRPPGPRRPGRVELPFADETELEELVEALERAAGR